MKELNNHPFMDNRTVKAYETSTGGYVQVTDVRDIFNGNYSVERYVEDGGMESIYSSCSMEKCIAKAEKYAFQH